jgi:hypothetical protein
MYGAMKAFWDAVQRHFCPKATSLGSFIAMVRMLIMVEKNLQKR